ncbi:MAG: antitoxin VapB family protein [Candidatus Hodarchaeales archaeon]
MAYKTVALSEEAYEALKALKGEKESFNDVVLKLVRREQRIPFSNLAGVWSDISDAEAVEMLERIARVDHDAESMSGNNVSH